MFENITYYILDISEKDKINFSEIIHKEFESLRKSVDGTKCILKIEGPPKSFLNTINTLDGPYSHSQMRSIIEDKNWSN